MGRKDRRNTKFEMSEDFKKQYCGVEGCESDVTNKGAWVGIFM
jgi:hypothetical protein